MIRERSLATAGQAAAVVTRLGIQPRLAPGDMRRTLRPDLQRTLDALL